MKKTPIPPAQENSEPVDELTRIRSLNEKQAKRIEDLEHRLAVVREQLMNQKTITQEARLGYRYTEGTL